MRSPTSIRKIADPVKRIAAANAAGAETQRLASEYAQITRETVREMRETMSYGEVARALGVSRTRIQQLER
jgi:uncharacterized protein (DUF433 family)